MPHRIVMGSMHTGLETAEDGGASLAAFYVERVAGGAGLVVTGGLAISEGARGGPDYARLDDPDFRARLGHVALHVHAAGGSIAAQLFHAGRYAVTGGMTTTDGRPAVAVAPSAVPWRAARGPAPTALDAEGIRQIIADFASAARAAVDAGCDAVEIMGSEGYLIDQFVSPVTNLRTDAWGGDAERRRTFPLAVLDAVRAAVDVPLIVRMTGDDLMPQGTPAADVDALALAYAAHGADALAIGIGWHESPVPTVQAVVPHGAWLAWAERIAAVVRARHTDVPIIASNRITSIEEADRILERGEVDAVAMARPFLADPQIIAKSIRGTPHRVVTCIGCDQACIDRSLAFLPVSCLVNPRAGREVTHPLVATRTARRFHVVGSGPAGLAAALDLVRRGHRVTLWEEKARPGGQFDLAWRVPGKEDYLRSVHGQLAEFRSLGGEMRLGQRPTIDQILAGDGIVVATGVRPRRLAIPGIDLPHVIDYEQALTGGVPPGAVAIIGGGGIGIDVASTLVHSHDPARRAERFAGSEALRHRTDLLDHRQEVASETEALRAPARTTGFGAADIRAGSDVTVLRRSGRFGDGIGPTSRWVALAGLRRTGVALISGLEYLRIDPRGVDVRLADQREVTIPATTVIVCAGQEPQAALAADLRGLGVRLEVAGGARDASRIDAVRATEEGLRAARRLTA